MSSVTDGGPMPFPFAAFTDPAGALALLQGCSTELFGAPTTLARCEVIDSLYKTYVNPASWPKSTLGVCWRVECFERVANIERVDNVDNVEKVEYAERADAAATAIFYAKVHLEGRSHAAWQQLNERGAGAGAMHLPALDMIVWRFPHDPGLRHLTDVVLGDRVRARLPWAALHALGAGAADDVAIVHVEPVRYQPERRCITRCVLRWHGPSNVEGPAAGAVAAPRELIVYAKAFGDERGPAAYARQQHYWRSAALHTCEPLAYDESIRTLWAVGVEGRALADVIDRANHAHYLDQAAAALAVVHGSDARELGVNDTISLAELLADGLKKIDKLGLACPPSRAPLARVAAQVQRLGKRVMRDDGQRRVLHGDFHIGQMLAVGADVYLFDFDSLALGDPEQDLAEFVVALLSLDADDDFIRTVAATLARAYGARVPWPLRIDHLRWYAWVEFVTRCWRFHRQQRPGWAEALELALARLPVLDAAIEAMQQ